MHQHTLADYIQLIDSFVRGEISGLEFEQAYLQMFKEDPTIRPETRVRNSRWAFLWRGCLLRQSGLAIHQRHRRGTVTC